MADLQLTTKRRPGEQEVPPQVPPPPSEFFGEASNDIQLSQLNDFELISGLDKLKQDIKKVILTELGENTNFELYGSELQSTIGEKVDFNFIKAKVKEQVINALEVLEFVNRENPDDDERPETLNVLSVEQLNIDQVEVQMTVTTVSGKSVSTGLVITA